MIQLLTFQQATDIIISRNPTLELFFKSQKYYPAINEHTLFALAVYSGQKIEWQKVSCWDDVESGKYDDLDEFLKLLIAEWPSPNGNFLLYTMDSYSIQKAFWMNAEDLMYFSENYSDYCGSNVHFIQPLDYIVFSEEKNCFTLLYHEGLLMNVCLSAAAVPRE